MALHLLSIEIRKTVKHPALWIGLGCLAVLLAIVQIVSHAQIAGGYNPASGGLESDLLSALFLFQWVGILAYATTAATIAASDYPDRSIQLWLARGVPRPMLLTMRLIAILLFSLLIVVFTFLFNLGLAALSRQLFFGAVDAANLNLAALLPAVLRVFWGALPYLALTVLLAIVSRSPFFAAGGAIIYATVLENLLLTGVQRHFPALVKYLPITLTRTLQTANLALDRAAPLEAFAVPQLQTAVFIGVWFIVIYALSLLIFIRQDLGG